MNREAIPYGRQEICQADIDAVVNVLRSEWLTQGPAVPAFEKAVAERCGAQYAVALNSATAALHAACLALGVGPGDIAWTTPNTFVASADCARYCGGSVDFVDIDARTWCISTEALTQKLYREKRRGLRLPKVVIPVHFAGQSCDMAALAELAKEYGFRVIEDASHAIGGRYNETSIGSGRYSDITVFSFHPVKIITAGEGGMAVTNDVGLAERMRRIRSHGVTRDPAMMTRRPDGPWYYEQLELGFNYRMTDIQAALGLSQLNRLDEFVSRRNVLARNYSEAFVGLPVAYQFVPDGVYSARHLYVIRVPADQHLRMFESLRSRGINVNLHYMPVYWHPEYRRLGFTEGQCPVSEQYYREAITLPLYPSMTDEQQRRVIDSVKWSLESTASAA